MSQPDAKRPETKHPGTKQRILAIATDLFARQGYTATTIADIARGLGTTTAALYYHFPSKSAILAGLLAEPIKAYTRLLDGLDSGEANPEDLLGAIIDICADSRDLATIFDRDPAALAMIDAQLPRSSRELTEQTLAALAGPGPDRAAMIRASAALAVAKAATLAAIDLGGGTLSAADRAEVLAIALRTLKALFPAGIARPPLPRPPLARPARACPLALAAPAQGEILAASLASRKPGIASARGAPVAFGMIGTSWLCGVARRHQWRSSSGRLTRGRPAPGS